MALRSHFSVLLVETKAESDYWKLPLKTTEGPKEQVRTSSIAATREISVDAAAVEVLLGLKGIFTVEEQQRINADPFVKSCRVCDVQLIGSLEVLLPASTGSQLTEVLSKYLQGFPNGPPFSNLVFGLFPR